MRERNFELELKVISFELLLNSFNFIQLCVGVAFVQVFLGEILSILLTHPADHAILINDWFYQGETKSTKIELYGEIIAL